MNVFQNVYVMSLPDFSYSKIGRAVNADQRRAELQTGCPLPLTVFAVLNPETSAAALETALHRFFRNQRTVREWFAVRPWSVVSAATSVSELSHLVHSVTWRDEGRCVWRKRGPGISGIKVTDVWAHVKGGSDYDWRVAAAA